MATIEHETGTLSAPGFARVRVFDGRVDARVPRWTMAQRAELKPLIAKILARINSATVAGVFRDLADVFNAAEDEIHAVCRDSTQLPPEYRWEDLPWAELPDIAQAVWEVNVATPDGRGLAGKALSLITPLLVALVGDQAASAKPRLPSNLSATPMQSEERPPDSPSSLANGAAMSNDSATA